MSTNEPNAALRLTLLSVIVIGLFLALLSRLWFLQVLAGERYAQLAESNRVRIVVLEPPRGRILASDGRELVKNRPAQTISADPKELLNGLGEPRDEEAAATLRRLSQLLELPEDEIITRLTSRKYSPFRAVPIKEDVPPEVIFAVGEHQELFRGVVAETLPVRTYPEGALAPHLVGYIGEISEAELDEPRYVDYRGGDLIGWAGLERTYEPDLHGQEGLRKLEVNASGVVLNVLGEQKPVRGNDLKTTLDIDLQRNLEAILQDGILASRKIARDDGTLLPSVAGSAVVLDPRDGSIKAMASWPTYDPSVFVGGISRSEWDVLSDPTNEYPLINRAIQSAYPPGSVFKIVSGAAAMNAGLIGPNSTVSCPPSWKLADITFRNWSERHEGNIDLSTALMRSCDTFFYELANQWWSAEQNASAQGQPVDEVLPRVAKDFGMGRTLGVDLPAERAGVVPGREWREEYWSENKDVYCSKADKLDPGTYAQRVNQDLCLYGGRWRGGDAVNTSIGQGDVLTTPLQVAASYAAVANGGTLFKPHLGTEVLTPDGKVARAIAPEPIAQLPITPEQLAEIRQGLERVVMAERGTGAEPFKGFPLDQIPVAGKTGTAEVKPKIPYAWFAAYAPSNDPRYVVVVSVEEGGGGSQTAAPIARRILEAAFGLEISPFRAGPGNVD